MYELKYSPYYGNETFIENSSLKLSLHLSE